MKVFRTILFTLIIIGMGYLFYENYNVKLENEYLTQRIENIEEYTEDLSNTLNKFHTNLYASTEPVGRQGTHPLSISDSYYKDNFTQSK